MITAALASHRFVGHVAAFVALSLWAGALRVELAAAESRARIEIRDGMILRGPTETRRLALAFTGHEFGEGATSILDTLSKRSAKASFFLTGSFLTHTQFTATVQRIVTAGHYLGPHSDAHLLYCSWDAARTTLVSRATFEEDLRRNQEKIDQRLEAAQTIHPPRYFLPPFEHANAQIAEWTQAAGFTLLNSTPGTRAAADYTENSAANYVASQTIFESILAREQTDRNGLNGFILLMHVGAGPRRTDKFWERLPDLLETLSNKGYEFVRVDELLSSANGDKAGRLFVRASQIGYRPGDSKNALAFADVELPESFAIVDDASGEEVFRGPPERFPGEHWGPFSHHAELNFTALRRPGTYRVAIAGARSGPFRIADDAFAELFEAGLEFMRQQRCGFNPWLGTNCHQLDGRTAYGPLPAGSTLDARGGWHDAGDLLKYLLTSGNATAQLLLAWELRSPRAVAVDRVDALGRPGTNGIPDVLDEARWGLDWLLKLHPAADQLYHQVADDRDHIGLRLPQNETADYGWGRGGPRVVYAADGRPQGLAQYQSESTGLANLAGRHAAALALAWQVWHEQTNQREWAERCLASAKSAYELGRAQEGVQQGNSVRAPYRYEETTWADDMEWGASELFRATREPRYLQEARRYARLAGSESWMGREQTKHYQFYPFMNVGHFRLHGVADAELRRELEGFYREGLERCVRAGSANPYRAGVPFIWCSDNLVVALATQGLLFERMTGDRRYRDFIAKQRDWLLGRNPWGYTFITEMGRAFPTEVHLQTTRLTGRRVRGGLVDGPVYERIFKSLRGVSITEPDPLADFQDARAVYHNDFHDYSTNEPTMDGTASAVLLWALAAGAL